MLKSALAMLQFPHNLRICVDNDASLAILCVQWRYQVIANLITGVIIMKNKLVGFILGVVVGALIFGSVAIATSNETRTLSAVFRGITIEIDRTQYTPKDVNGNEVEPFIVDGTTYLPLRAIAEAFDKEVTWEAETSKVLVFTKSEPVTEEEVESAFIEGYLSDDTLEEYKVDSVESWGTNTWLVGFSVLPKEGEEGWMAGNGEEGEDGWIVEKSLFVYVLKIDGVVNLTVLGTGI